jgi:hypothetical protein
MKRRHSQSLLQPGLMTDADALRHAGDPRQRIASLSRSAGDTS